jgi:hypothetical protein
MKSFCRCFTGLKNEGKKGVRVESENSRRLKASIPFLYANSNE